VSDQRLQIAEEPLAFGSFELLRSDREIFNGGARVRIGGRALDILIALVERRGEMVTKRELMSIAWPHSMVEESNLRVHISALRKLLGEGQEGQRFIDNVAGRGYVFVAPVTRNTLSGAAAKATRGPTVANRLVGRDRVVVDLVNHAAERRLLTIVGPAGVGKSAVAAAVGDALRTTKRVYWVDIALVARPELLPAALAAALDVAVLTNDPIANLISFLREQSLTIVLDNCEHLTADLAPMIERLLNAAPEIAIIATSREPIAAAAERVVRLKPLKVPETFEHLTAQAALAYSAIRLFVERASSSSNGFDFTDNDAPAVAEICVRVDGLPLAIELIAARADLFGIRALATSLGERLMLSASGNRTADRRSRSLRGALDWSYDLLSPTEQLVLRRLAVFRGPFSIDSATSIASAEDLSSVDVFDAVASLCSKSLVAVDTSRSLTVYRLLHVTRSYASEKLSTADEAANMSSLHCDHFGTLLMTAQQEWETLSRQEWLDVYGHAIEDVRAALDWGFSPQGDARLAASLLIAALPYGFQLSLLDEFRKRAERALEVLGNEGNPLAALRLSGALCALDLNASIDDVKLLNAFNRITELCDKINDTRFKIEPLLIQAVFHIENGAFGESLASVNALAAEARERDDPLGILATDRIWAQAHHFAGNHTEARALAERVIRHPARVIPLVYSQATIDRQITMRIVIARSLWIEGHVDDARSLMLESLEMAAREGPLPTTFALGMGGCLISLWLGDEERALEQIKTLLAISARYTLVRWERLGEGYAAALRKMSAGSGKSNQLDLGFPAPVSMMHRMFLATAGVDTLDTELIRLAETGRCGWCQPEILRLRALQALDGGKPRAKSAAWLRESIHTARAQGALSWELRAAISFAERLRDTHLRAEARDLLESTCLKFRWGTHTADFRRAQLILKDLL